MTSHAPLFPDLLLGFGSVHAVGQSNPVQGPLFVTAVPGVRVLGPPTLARALVRAYVRALLGHGHGSAPAPSVGDAGAGAGTLTGVSAVPGQSLGVGIAERPSSIELHAGAQRCLLEVAAHGAPTERRLRSGPAEVWLAPEGHACARAPGEARGLWVPLDVRFDPGPLSEQGLVPPGVVQRGVVPSGVERPVRSPRS